ncbi:MAG: protein-L-isoaspartate(D-aspartate) O-methyltransferase [Bacteroidia bacterium]
MRTENNSQNTADQYKYKGMRRRLVQQLEEKGDFDPRILKAIDDIPRHFFLESAFAEQAYEDKAFSIGEGQTISQPYTVAYQTQLLDIKPGEKILEIGTGSGYQASILAALGAKVYSIERIQPLSDRARKVLVQLGFKDVKLFVGDGTLGLPKYAPYDKIIVTAAAPIVPDTLITQLAIGGWLVIPVGDKITQQMLKITRTGENTYKREQFDNFKFVPLIGDQGWKV